MKVSEYVRLNKPLPESFIHCGGYLDLQEYEHPLPESFTHCDGNLYLRGYKHPLPESFTHCDGNLHLSGYEHPLPIQICGGYIHCDGAGIFSDALKVQYFKQEVSRC